MSRAYYVGGVLERTYIHVRLYTKQRTAPSVAWRREACGREKALVNGLGRKDKTGPLLSSQHWNWFRSYVGENSEKQDGVPLEGLSLSMQPFWTELHSVSVQYFRLEASSWSYHVLYVFSLFSLFFSLTSRDSAARLWICIIIIFLLKCIFLSVACSSEVLTNLEFKTEESGLKNFFFFKSRKGAFIEIYSWKCFTLFQCNCNYERRPAPGNRWNIYIQSSVLKKRQSAAYGHDISLTFSMAAVLLRCKNCQLITTRKLPAFSLDFFFFFLKRL